MDRRLATCECNSTSTDLTPATAGSVGAGESLAIPEGVRLVGGVKPGGQERGGLGLFTQRGWGARGEGE